MEAVHKGLMGALPASHSEHKLRSQTESASGVWWHNINRGCARVAEKLSRDGEAIQDASASLYCFIIRNSSRLGFCTYLTIINKWIRKTGRFHAVYFHFSESGCDSMLESGERWCMSWALFREVVLKKTADAFRLMIVMEHLWRCKRGDTGMEKMENCVYFETQNRERAVCRSCFHHSTLLLKTSSSDTKRK